MSNLLSLLSGRHCAASNPAPGLQAAWQRSLPWWGREGEEGLLLVRLKDTTGGAQTLEALP